MVENQQKINIQSLQGFHELVTHDIEQLVKLYNSQSISAAQFNKKYQLIKDGIYEQVAEIDPSSFMDFARSFVETQNCSNSIFIEKQAQEPQESSVQNEIKRISSNIYEMNQVLVEMSTQQKQSESNQQKSFESFFEQVQNMMIKLLTQVQSNVIKSVDSSNRNIETIQTSIQPQLENIKDFIQKTFAGIKVDLKDKPIDVIEERKSDLDYPKLESPTKVEKQQTSSKQKIYKKKEYQSNQMTRTNDQQDQSNFRFKELAKIIKNTNGSFNPFEQVISHQISGFDSYCLLNLSENLLAVEGNKRIEILTKQNLAKTNQLDIKENFKASVELNGFFYLGCMEYLYKVDQKFKVVSSTKTQSCIRQIAVVDNEYLLAGQDYGNVIIFNVNEMQVVVQRHLKMGGGIKDIRKTTGENEFMFATLKGLFFAKVFKDINGKYKFVEATEHYLKSMYIRSFFEYEPSKIVLCVNENENLYLIDRETQQVTQLQNVSTSYRILTLRPIPNFNMVKNPYIFIRDENSISLVNMKSSKAHKVHDSKYIPLQGHGGLDYQSTLMEVTIDLNQNKVIVVFLECDGQNSYVKSLPISRDYVGALSVLPSLL